MRGRDEENECVRLAVNIKFGFSRERILRVTFDLACLRVIRAKDCELVVFWQTLERNQG